MASHGAAYFQSWNAYQLRLLFSSYNITETWQFALTWLAVVFTVIVHCTLGYVIISFDNTMISALGGFETPSGRNKQISDCDDHVDFHQMLPRPIGWQSVKLLHALLSGIRYGLSLMQMLVAMTFNPSLFVALIVGRVIGEYMCCDKHQDLIMGAHKPVSRYSGIAGRIIQSILCIPPKESSEEQEPLISVNGIQKYSRKSELLRLSLWILPRTISMILLVITIVWVMEVQGTFGFDSTSVFGWHALCMILFATVFTNEAVLTYTIPFFPQIANDRKILRTFHSLCHILALTSIILGLVAIVDFKSWNGMNTYSYDVVYTGHSWMGVLTIAVWVLQFFAGLWIYVFSKWPEGTENLKKNCIEIHHFFGYSVYALGLSTCATGFQDMQSTDAEMLAATIDATSGSNYMPPPSGAVLASVGPILLLALGVATFGALKFYPKILIESIQPPKEQIGIS